MSVASLKPYALPALAGLLVVVLEQSVFLLVDQKETSRYRKEVESRTQGQLSHVRANVERSLNRRLRALLALKAYVACNPLLDEAEFSLLADSLQHESDGIRHLALIRDDAISAVYPLAGNESAIGLRLLDIPDQAEGARRARQTGLPWLEGPIDLLQGGRAFVSRAPVYVVIPQGNYRKDDYWGLVSVVIDHDLLLAEIQEGIPADLEIGLYRQSLDADSPKWLLGDPEMATGQPLAQDVLLPIGNWVIAGRPKAGWPLSNPGSPLRWLLGAVVSLAAGLLAFLLLLSNSRYRQARKAALAASAAKSEFLANMSHEIRTPLNAVIGLTDALLRTSLTGEQRHYLETMKSSGDALRLVVDDILDFSKVEAGKLTLETIPFNVHDVIGDALRMLSPRAGEKSLELAGFVDPRMPTPLLGDPGRLRQVVINLVGNAIKFTETGEVVVRAEPADGELGHLRISVRDTGPGIEMSVRERLFAAFEQADASTTRKFGGSGLGLTICRRLAMLMGGDIQLESEPGQGSTFTFTVRLGVPEAMPAPGNRVVQTLAGVRVLIVDDNQSSRTILREQTQAAGMRPVVAASAEDGLRLLTAASQERDPVRVALIDQRMPGTDGLQLARRIRQRSELDEVKIFLLTPGLLSGQTERDSQPANVSGWLSKPVKRSDLLESLAAALDKDGKPASTVCEPKNADPTHVAGLNILVAEDSPANQQVARAFLKIYRHRVTVAGNGREAVRLFRQERFDVILMDVHMPEMDGLAATREIRQLERTAGGRIPIIAMTAHRVQDALEQCLGAGMDDFVAKPVQREELFAALDKAVGFLPGEPEAQPPMPAEGGSPRNETPSLVSALWQKPVEMFKGNWNLIREISQTYVKEVNDILARLPELVASGNCAEVKRLSHTLAGTTRLFELEQVEQLARRLEAQAKTGVWDRPDEIIARLNEILAPSLNEISHYAETGEMLSPQPGV